MRRSAGKRRTFVVDFIGGTSMPGSSPIEVSPQSDHV